MRAASLISEARARAGLSQAELARRAGTAQPSVSAYESGAKEPTFRTLQRLLAAAGAELRPQRAVVASSEDPGGLRRMLMERRAQILQIADGYGASEVRVFGSVARGDHTEHSDVDLIMDLPRHRVLLNVAGLAEQLSELLGVRVEVTTPRLLRPEIAAVVARDAIAL